ncbi:MAG: phosphopantothenoylcysteine decarboxylase [Planctomycetes bacterium]|nr:phosphopantothenoylcysteine decarboxylase [Planctomycetota bacterium]
MRLLVTAGPTREYLDDVRFLSNASSGRMGCAIARAAVARGHEVVLICGPLEVAPPPCSVRDVVSTADMLARCVEEFPAADALIMAAAPADFRPARRVRGKLKKSSAPRALRLARTPDILAELARRRGTQVMAGFALEARDLAKNARQKLREKGLDLIVANTPEAIAAERSTAHVFFPDGSQEPLEDMPKEAIAERLVEIVERLVAERRRAS